MLVTPIIIKRSNKPALLKLLQLYIKNSLSVRLISRVNETVVSISASWRHD